VDYITFSYYSSRCTSADPNVDQTAGNVFASVKNPHLKASDWVYISLRLCHLHGLFLPP
jgi:6-phospho-beta-glucosidase